MQTNSRLLALATFSIAMQNCSALPSTGMTEVPRTLDDDPLVTCSYAQLTDVALVNELITALVDQPTVPQTAQPQECVHLGCNDGAVVWFCNTDSKALTYGSRALGAQISLVVSHCETPDKSDPTRLVVSGSSQSAGDDKYIISVSAGTCGSNGL
ncbi:hypothetical protein LQW54_012038 [Pestalotiopsis sp. IQ-011]